MNGTTTVRLKESSSGRARRVWNSISVALSLTAIVLYLLFHYVLQINSGLATLPLWAAIIAGGFPLLYDLFRQVLNRQFGSDFLAGLSIVTATIMGELLVATIIVLMLSGGQTLEAFATKRASSVLDALAIRCRTLRTAS